MFTVVIKGSGVERRCRRPSFQVESLKLQMYNRMFSPPAEAEKHFYFLLLLLLLRLLGAASFHLAARDRSEEKSANFQRRIIEIPISGSVRAERGRDGS